MTAPIRDIPSDGEIIAVVRSQADLVDAFRTIKRRLAMSNAHCDELANMTEGHTDKCLGPTGAKEIGELTFGRLCWLFAVKFEMRIDLEQMKIMAEHWEDRQQLRLPAYSETRRVSKKLLEKAKPLILKDFSQLGNAARQAMLPSEHRSKIASKAAKSRWKKARATARQASAAKASPASPSSPGRR